jgi:hypothetical protein
MRSAIVFILVLPTILFSAFSQTIVHLTIDTDVNCIVADSSGRKTGVDSRYSKPYSQWIWMRQIPNSTIGYNTSNEGGPSLLEFEALLNSPSQDGWFTIQLIGHALRVAVLLIDVTTQHDAINAQEPRYEIEAIPIDKDSTVTYVFTYHSAPGSLTTLVKAVSPNSLLRDILAMRKLHWITSQSTADKYATLIERYSNQSKLSNLSDARSTLATIIQNISSDSSNTMTLAACKWFRPDIECLLKQQNVAR